MNFKKHYNEHDAIVKIPLRIENVIINDDGTASVFIDEEELQTLVDGGAVKLHKKDKTFENFNEAINYSNMLLAEADEELPADIPDDVADDIRGIGKDKRVHGQKSQAGKPEVTWVDETGKEHKFEYSLGNAKIGTDTMIVNMSSAKGCMSLTLGLCSIGAEGKCYALNPELRYPDEIGAYRARQETQWQCLTAQGISAILKKIKVAIPGIKYIRINEAGEFRNIPKGEDNPLRIMAQKKLSPEKFASLDEVDDIAKLKEIAAMTPELQFYTYSHRIDLFTPGEKSNLGSNVVINGSGFMIDNAFKIVNYSDFVQIMQKIAETKSRKLTIPGFGELDNVVDCLGNCAVCNRCKVNKSWNIIIPKHGGGTEKAKVYNRVKKNIINNEKFLKVLGSTMSVEEKVKSLLKMGKIFDPKDDLNYLFRNLPDRKEYWAGIINDENVKNEFLDAIIGAVNPISLDITSNRPSKTALVKSLSALQGKLTNELKTALEAGKKSSIELKQKNIKKLKSLKTKAKVGTLSVKDMPKNISKKYRTVSTQMANAIKKAKALKAKVRAKEKAKALKAKNKKK